MEHNKGDFVAPNIQSELSRQRRQALARGFFFFLPPELHGPVGLHARISGERTTAEVRSITTTFEHIKRGMTISDPTSQGRGTRRLE